jgi:hypothetical protein
VKRCVSIVAILLVLGAVINLAVAWACGQRAADYTKRTTHPLSPAELKWWDERAPEGFPPRPVGVADSYGLGLTQSLLWELEPEASSNLGANVARWRAGWPLRAMERSRWVQPARLIVVERDTAHLRRAWGARRVLLPTRVLWPGFAVNTAFYALLAGAAVAAVIAVRRVMRRKHGLCPGCGYPVGGSPICTECGQAIRR